MELAIPLVVLGGMYIVNNNKSSQTQEQSQEPQSEEPHLQAQCVCWQYPQLLQPRSASVPTQAPFNAKFINVNFAVPVSTKCRANTRYG